MATVDVLGEEISNDDEARAIAGQYHDALAQIDDAGLDANVSVKLTALGLELDHDLCADNLESVVHDAAARDSFVRIDMEDSSTTERTLQLYRSLRARGHANVGVVLQAYMRRTFDDLEGLDNVRLCKGIYVEPASIAYRNFDEVRTNYVRCLERLVEQGSLRRDRNARRVPDRRSAAHRARDGAHGRPVRVSDAARCSVRAR